jgi:GNAT superfamily N-acetyltransferase
VIRSPTDDDLRLVRSAWLTSYSKSDFARLATPPPYWEENGHGGRAYYEGQTALIERLIAASMVLVSEGDDGLLDGFAVGWPRTLLHYVYVKQVARGRGVARALLAALELREGERVVYTHRSHGIRGSPRGWTFDPSPTTMLGATMTERLRIKRAYFGETRAIPFTGLNGQSEQRENLRAEQDKAVMWLEPETGTVVVENRAMHSGERETIYIALSACRYVTCYPKGHGPSWEKEAGATPPPPVPPPVPPRRAA